MARLQDFEATKGYFQCTTVRHFLVVAEQWHSQSTRGGTGGGIRCPPCTVEPWPTGLDPLDLPEGESKGKCKFCGGGTGGRGLLVWSVGELCKASSGALGRSPLGTGGRGLRDDESSFGDLLYCCK